MMTHGAVTVSTVMRTTFPPKRIVGDFQRKSQVVCKGVGAGIHPAPLRRTGSPAATKYTRPAVPATAWLSRPAWSQEAQAMASSGTMPGSVSFAAGVPGRV